MSGVETEQTVWWQTTIHVILWLPIYLLIFTTVIFIGTLVNFIQSIGIGSSIGIIGHILLSGFSAHVALVLPGMALNKSNKVVVSTILGTLYVLFAGIGIYFSVADGLGIKYILTSTLSAIAVLVAIISYSQGYRTLKY